MSQIKPEFVVPYRALQQRAEAAFVALHSPRGDDYAEAVHEWRTALRGLRTMLRALSADPAVAALRPSFDALFRAAAPARDVEAALMRLTPFEADWPRNRRRPSTELKRLLAERRRELLGRLDADEAAWRAQFQAGEAALAARDAAWSRKRRRCLIDDSARRLLKRARSALKRALKRNTPADWHAARLTIKRCRVWADLFDAALPKRLRRRAERLKPLQAALGEQNDWAVLAGGLPDGQPLPADWSARVDAERQVLLSAVRRLTKQLLG